MTNLDEKLCLQWNDFSENISSAFGDMRQDKEFTDVTLACEDGQQVEVHKVVLVASSPFFLNILKRNKHPHPLIYMRGVRPENLMTMVDFFYHGEANIYQENLDSFLVLAEELQLKGLRGNQTEPGAEVFPKSAKEKRQNYGPATEQLLLNKEVSNENIQSTTNEKALVPTDHTTNNTDMESLNQQVKSMMTFSENADPHGKQCGRARICKVFGKEGSYSNMVHHIEANHIAGISIPCGLCSQDFSSRNALEKKNTKIDNTRINKKNCPLKKTSNEIGTPPPFMEKKQSNNF